MIALGGSLSFVFLMLITRSLRSTPDIVLTMSQFGGTSARRADVAHRAVMPISAAGPVRCRGSYFGGCAAMHQLLLKLAPASVVAPITFDDRMVVIFGFVVRGDVPSISTLVGAAIIIGAGIDIFLREAAARARGSVGQSAGVATFVIARSERVTRRAPDDRLRVRSNPSFRGRHGRSLRFARNDETPPLFPCRTARVLQRRPDAARQAEAVDRVEHPSASKRRSSTPPRLEAVFLQDVPRRRVRDAGG